MERAAPRDSTSAVRRDHPDWLSSTRDGGEELLIERLDDLVDWSGWLTVCSAEREPAFADIVWRSPGA